MTPSPPTSTPLQGVRVVEVGQYISAPYAGKLLADLGADVVKVESPTGDPMRRWQGGAQASHSPQFEAYNRGKRAVTLDLKDPRGLGTLVDLVAAADVLLENFRPGVAERLGFGYAELRTRHPRLVYCSVSGFGVTGPYAGRPSYDTIVSAIGGMYSQLMPPGSPRPIGPAFSDLLSGVFAVQGVLAALVARSTSGRGQKVGVSMAGALLDFLVEPATTYLATGEVAGPDSRPRRAQSYACTGSDGKAFVVHMSVPEKFWTGLLGVLERPDLADDARFATREQRVRNYDDLDAVLKAETAKRPRHEWFERLEKADIPHGPLNSFGDIFDDPQVVHMDLVRELAPAPGAEPIRTIRPSTSFSASDEPPLRPAPATSTDPSSILAEWNAATGKDE
ncbi:CaiB/BaiF CoA transferase family protein [Phytoactinopolyspora limicola]|uniref:CaiB/BaiF CoA transferase family protein n=1 Tax=Phytoactinopolyspora limicola TaxID=2715536 RepID=UPI00140A4DA1|nr:CaiB/BaiF CoA-transferase family protein [Phytoactinopolyspora limicola]